MSARRLVSLWGPVLLYAAALYVLSEQRQLPPIAERIWDKALHASAWAGLTLVSLRATHGGKGPLRAVATLAALLLIAAYAIGDEFHQRFVPGRDPSAADVLADLVGALCAVGGTAVVQAVRRRLARNAPTR